MANDYFRFKQFIIYQGQCAMKVGTDGTLLGAWAQGGKNILDIGTGSGLIALMMAQRFPEARVTGIDIDAMAVKQARENVCRSPFSERVVIVEADVTHYLDSETDAMHRQGLYDCIVSNPPFFEHALGCPDAQRHLARHTDSLTYRSLFMAARRLLTAQGVFSLIVPFDYIQKCTEEASLTGFFLSRQWAVKTNSRKPPRRYLMAFSLHSPVAVERGTGILEEPPGCRSDWYRRMTEEFYLY
jgi:tRNA1Val (adenine37-N6)-methyltransferase